MKEFLTQFRQCALFDRIDDEGLLKTMNCLNVQVMPYEKGRVIFHQGDAAKYFGVVLSGSIHVVKNHSNGSHTLVGAVDEGDLFAESCVCAGEASLPASFIAAKDSLIAVFDHVRVINGCRNNGCLAHSMLVVNLMRSIARKNLTLSQKLSIVTQRTTREKLMTYLFSEAVNYQPCSIEYEDNCIYFNMYHGMCGGCGTFLWIKTTIYEYIKTNYNVNLDPGSTLMIDSPILEEEYVYPKLEDIPNDSPITSLKKDEVWFPGLDYLFGFGNLIFSDSIHYEFEIPKKDMMKFVSKNDGSPMSVVAAIMVKAL